MTTPTLRTLIPLFDELHGERIAIRPYRLEDDEQVFEAIEESRERIRLWLPFADQTAEENRDWVIRSIAKWLLREDLNMGIWENESGRYLGGVGLHICNWDIRYFEIGYWLRTAAEGHGYMTEAVRLLTTYAFTALGANRVAIHCDARNTRSAAVPQRLGFVREGCLRNFLRAPDGELADQLVFALTFADPRWPR